MYDSYCCFRNRDEKRGVRILWEITSKCNMKCSFCHVAPKKDCSYDEICFILDKLSNIKIKDIIISGGEPLVRDDIFDILQVLKEKDIEMDLCTNATLITEEKALLLKKYLSEISVSLDSIDDEHLNLKGSSNGYIQQIINGIQILVSSGHNVHLICTVNKKNYNILENIMTKAEKLKVHSLTFLGLVESNIYDKSMNKSNVLEKYELDKVRKDIMDLRKCTSKLIINTKRIFFKNECESCEAGKKILGISSEGKISPCILHQEEGVDMLKKDFCIENINFNHYNSCIK